MEIQRPLIIEKQLADAVVEEYLPGSADRYDLPGIGALPIWAGDTCIIAGGDAKVLRSIQGDRLLSLWPDFPSPTRFSCLKEDQSALTAVTHQTHPVIEGKPIPETDFRQGNADIARQLGLKLEESEVLRADGAIYSILGPDQFATARSILECSFGYPAPSNKELEIFIKNGGHVGGIVYQEQLVGITTVLAAYLRGGTPQERTLFLDSIGILPQFRGTKPDSTERYRLGTFGFKSAVIAATAQGVENFSFTYDPYNSDGEDRAAFYFGLGAQPREYMMDLYGAGSSRFYMNLDFRNTVQMTRLVNGRTYRTIPESVSTQIIPLESSAIEEISQQLPNKNGTLVIADYIRNQGYVGYWKE